MPKSDSLPLRRWPCWPGPYSRLLMGDFGRPQIFWPSRRSILYFASWRLVIRVLVDYRSGTSFPKKPVAIRRGRALRGTSCLVEDRALLCPGFPGTDRSAAEAPAQTAGRETLRGPFWGPRRAGYLGGNPPSVKLAQPYAVPVAAASPERMPKRRSAASGGRPEVKIARVLPEAASAVAPPNSETTRRAMAGAGSMKLTGHRASRCRRSKISG